MKNTTYRKVVAASYLMMMGNPHAAQWEIGDDVIVLMQGP